MAGRFRDRRGGTSDPGANFQAGHERSADDVAGHWYDQTRELIRQRGIEPDEEMLHPDDYWAGLTPQEFAEATIARHMMRGLEAPDSPEALDHDLGNLPEAPLPDADNLGLRMVHDPFTGWLTGSWRDDRGGLIRAYELSDPANPRRVATINHYPDGTVALKYSEGNGWTDWTETFPNLDEAMQAGREWLDGGGPPPNGM